MSALIEAARDGRIADAEIAVVVSDKSDAAGIEKARASDIETLVIERRKRSRVEHDAEIITELRRRGVELVCLAGYMRLLSPEFVRAFPNRIINVHPSLLPAFPGLEAQRQAFDYGVKFAGCTVHLVDEMLDHGRILAQSVVPVFDDDSVESLAARILIEEHRLYVEVAARFARGDFRIEGRRVLTDGKANG